MLSQVFGEKKKTQNSWVETSKENSKEFQPRLPASSKGAYLSVSEPFGRSEKNGDTECVLDTGCSFMFHVSSLEIFDVVSSAMIDGLRKQLSALDKP